MTSYADDLTLGEARRRYFGANGFGDGGYDKTWVKLQAGPLAIFIPNTKARVRSVRLHDLHHVLTEYDTTWTGESEIGAWEVGAGCGDHWAAWLLNFNAIAIGLMIAPRATFRAFVRGRRTQSLYGGEFRESLLDERVGIMRGRLGLQQANSAAPADSLLFAGVSLVSILTLALVTGLTLAPLLALVSLSSDVYSPLP